MIVLGLTGSIGMGKTTTAGFFRDAGVPVWDADETVHRLYGRDGDAVEPLSRIVPDAVRDGEIDRSVLREWIQRDPAALAQIEEIVHPLVAEQRRIFVDSHRAAGTLLVVLDIPLLFENANDGLCDATLVVSAPAETQRARVLARPGMTEAHLKYLLSRQMPDAEKRARATYVIETNTPEQTRSDVLALIADLTRG